MENNSTWTPTQPSPTNWTPEGFRVVPSVFYALGAVFLTFAASIAYIVFAVAAGSINPHKPAEIPPLQQIYAQFAAYAVLLPYLLYFLPRVAGRSLGALGFRAPGLREIGVGVAGAAVMFLTVSAASALIESLTHYHDVEPAVALLAQMQSPYDKLLFVLVAAVLAPIIEELAFRGFLFNALSRYLPFAGAALLSGILFGLMHASSAHSVLSVSVPLALGGVVLAGVYRYAGCYWSNVITHALFNSISLVAVFVFHAKP